MEDTAKWEGVLDDDDDFLADDSDGFLPEDSPESTPDSPSSFQRTLKDETSPQEPDEFFTQNEPHLPESTAHDSNESNEQATPFPPQQSSNLFHPHQPSSSEIAQLSPKPWDGTGVSRPDLGQWPAAQNTFQSQPQRPAAPSRGESFVDQSKAGYKSPYDLPMDISKPRKRAPVRRPPPTPTLVGPPPRRSSQVSEQLPSSSPAQLQSSFSPTSATGNTKGPPPIVQNPTPNVSNEPMNAPQTKESRDTSSFYHELPVTAKPRPAAAQGRYNPAQTPSLPSHVPVAANSVQELQQGPMSAPSIQSENPSTESYFDYQLQRPERLDPYASVSAQLGTPPVVASKRYSPAPPTSQTAPPPSRYSPAPPASQVQPAPSAPVRYSPVPPVQSQPSQLQHRGTSQPQPSPQLPSNQPPQNRYFSQPAPPVGNPLSFQPRTSSPLAHHRSNPTHQTQSTSDPGEPLSITLSTPLPAPQHTSPEQPPPSGEPLVLAHDFIPPRRSQTQSPGKRGPTLTTVPTPNDVAQRPASVHGPSSPGTSANVFHSFSAARRSPKSPGSSQNPNSIPPKDDSQQVDQQRWRGTPIFRFGVGGTVLSSFPRHIPMYSAGSTTPMTRMMAGEVRLRDAKEIVPFHEHAIKFPGPLRSKSKKKDVLAWLSDRVVAMENMPLPPFTERVPDSIKRHDEKVLLWKMVRVLVEHDGCLDGGAEVQKAVNVILSPESSTSDELPSVRGAPDSRSAGIYKPAESQSRPKTSDPAAIESLRKLLLRGEREKAVWTAVDNQLWAHAMLMSSTLDPPVWRQVAQEFVRQEVKLVGRNTEPLAALYEVFAGNLEESIDELVPPSARAGFQMVSKAGGDGVTKNVSEGLDRWRETLSLVLNNRSREDHNALAALGRLLASYGRIEASHLCYLFANPPHMPSVFGGADDPQASIVLLGADHRSQPHGFFDDTDSILLTEIYEFATSMLPSNSKSTLIPHLQVYKLQRVKALAVAGYKLDAQAYCDAIGASLRSSTKLSPYYHPQFLTELDEMTRRLSQTPTETSAWISRPTMGKVSDSMWNKFTTFVAGDDSDRASTGSGRDPAHESGPFAKVSGTPSMSRSGSNSDLYGSHTSNAPQVVPNITAASRYAPNGPLSARSSSELTRGKSSLEAERSPSYMQQGTGLRSQYEPSAALNQQGLTSPPMLSQHGNSYIPLGTSPPVQTYQATPPQSSYMPLPQQGNARPASEAGQYRLNSDVPGPASSLQAAASGYEVNNSYLPANYLPSKPEAAAPDVQAQQSSYTPSAQYYGSYEPPSAEYVPYQPETEPSPDAVSEESKPKKSFMEGDDDAFPSMTASSQIRPFTQASEGAPATTGQSGQADTALSKKPPAAPPATNNTLKPKASWFSLFSRSKDSGSITADAGGEEPKKVIQANLGEENSFYYDKELKKWVNKKDPASMQATPKAAPPPPKAKGPVGRVVNESLGLGIGSAGDVGAGPPAAAAAPPPPPSTRPTGPPGLNPNSRPPSAGGRSGGGGGGAPAESRSAIPDPSNGHSSTSATPPLSSSPSSTAPAPAPRPPPPPASSTSDIDALLGGTSSAGGGTGTVRGRRARGGAGRYVDVMAQQ